MGLGWVAMGKAMCQARVRRADVVRAWRAARPPFQRQWMGGLGRGAFIGLLVAAAFAGAAWAHSDEQKSGTHWLRKCTSPEVNGQIECAIYVRAIVEYDEMRGTLLKEARFICPEQGLTIGQSREIVLQYLRAHPQDLKLPFVLLAHQGLAAAFPCAHEPGAAAPAMAAPAK
jgi:Rap1a immunity proteins